jgi:hypothetical protein
MLYFFVDDKTVKPKISEIIYVFDLIPLAYKVIYIIYLKFLRVLWRNSKRVEIKQKREKKGA